MTTKDSSSGGAPPLIILTGPTAVGKTALSISLAKAIGGSVISADSMQVYRGMDIGSAKITPGEMDGVKHYLVDILEPTEEFHVVRFQEMAKAAMAEIRSAGKIPIVVGGTGFYIQALLYDIDFTEEDDDPAFRAQALAAAREKGNGYLHAKLREVDPASADVIHENNLRRVIRALEFYEKTGTPISEHNEKERRKDSPYNFCYFVLNEDRARLYERIDARVDKMLAAGLADEVRALTARGVCRGMTSMQGLGYKEMAAWLDGETDYEEAVRVLKRDTRRFAKRQLTWFKRQEDVIWVNRPDFENEEAILAFLLQTIQERGILCCRDKT